MRTKTPIGETLFLIYFAATMALILWMILVKIL
jgi:uncharacterized membrane protein